MDNNVPAGSDLADVRANMRTALSNLLTLALPHFSDDVQMIEMAFHIEEARKALSEQG